MRGGHDPRALAQRSAQVRRERAAARSSVDPQAAGDAGTGLVVSVDPSSPRAVLQELATNPKTPHSARVQAARALMDADTGGYSADPTVARYLAARDMLATLDPGERLAYLREAIPPHEL
jgi:hypothetical protein